MAVASHGFTLVELMVVVAVLGMITMLTAPSFAQTLAKNHLRGAAAEAYSDMQFARAAAVERNANVTVTFNATGYQITNAAQTLKSVTFGGGIGISAGSAMTITFNPVRGTAAVANGPLTLTHAATSGALRVTVSTLGRPDVCTSSGSISGYTTC